GDACIPRRQVSIVVGSHVEPECAGSERPRGRQALSLRTEADAITAVRPNCNLTRPNAFCHGAAIGNRNFRLNTRLPSLYHVKRFLHRQTLGEVLVMRQNASTIAG